MRRMEYRKFLSLYLLIIVMLFSTEAKAGDKIDASSHCASSVVQAFPTSGPERTRWDVCFQAVSRNGLIIQSAMFRRSPSSPFVEVLNDGRISEIFVPYHPGSPRFHDVTDFNFPLLTLTAADCPASQGTLIGSNKICKEVQDRGLLWKDDGLVRRGQELVLWTVLDAANYNYIIEWSFRDDGTILGRAGSTGPKLGGPDDTTGHMHNFTWRLDLDLNGAGGDSVRKTSHVESGLAGSSSTATDSETLVSTEVGLLWSPNNFTTLDISDSTLENNNGRSTSYELIPLRSGTARHSEAFTKKDFWVTAFNGAELNARNLPTYLTGQSVTNADIVVWYTGSAHHENNPRDEDRQTVPVLWVGFELSPHNLFNGTPLFP